MKRLRVNLLFHAWRIVFFCTQLTAAAQEIPLETWRTHTSYNRIQHIAVSSSANAPRIFAAAPHGIISLRFSGNEVITQALTKLNGLSGADISSMAYDSPREQLLLGYADGTLDIVRDKEVIQFTQLRNPPAVTGSRQISHISVRQNLAYLSTGYGVVVFDLTQLQVKETWRDLGLNGAVLSIRQSTFKDDSIFLATANGIIAGNLNTNLLNFANWKRFSQGVFNASIPVVAVFNNLVYAGINGSGLYAYEDGLWKLVHLSGESFNHLHSSGNLFITTVNGVWQLNASNQISQVISNKISAPLCAAANQGVVWIGDARNGLFNTTGESFIPNGPTFSETFRLGRDAANSIYALSGGFNPGFAQAGKHELVNFFSNGVWKVSTDFIAQDVTDILFNGSATYVASFGSGLQVINNGTSVVYTTNNSPLQSNRIVALAPSSEGVWIAAYGTAASLYLLKRDNTWETITLPFAGARFPLNMLTDRLGQVWLALNPATGGGLVVFNRAENKSVLFTEANGSGSLPSRQVYSLAVDRNGYVWAGTGAGVAYFPNPAQVFSGNINSVKPVFNGRFLLRDETVTAIAVDGGNRKWFGTQRGTWLFNAFGDEEIYSFSAANSPLLSDQIADIDIHPVSGEVFFATAKGIMSFRSTATQSENVFGSVKIFPNPVTANFTGLVSISGLATDAFVKVTDISGKLVWQTNASGGTATWNVQDYTGRRAATGMYLVIAVSTDGSESIIGKLAVIN